MRKDLLCHIFVYIHVHIFDTKRFTKPRSFLVPALYSLLTGIYIGEAQPGHV